MNNGVSYEKYVQRIQQTIIDSQWITGTVGVKVEHNVHLNDEGKTFVMNTPTASDPVLSAEQKGMQHP
jgi:hypothetical protein